jgi:RelA/SpoT family protein
MQLPPELTWLEWVVGTDWPDGDEDALWRMRDAWMTAAHQVRDIIGDGETAYFQVIGGMAGTAADQFTAYWQQFAEGDQSYLAKLAHACESLAQHCDSTATEIEYAKYQFIIFLIILACQIAYMLAMAAPTFGASTAGIPVAEVATQSLIRVIAQNVLRSIIMFVLQNVVTDVVIQMVQLGEGHRTHFDASKTIHAAVDGAISGAIFGVVGTGIHLGAAKIAPNLGESMLGRIGEGAATNVLGSLATSVATGQPLTLEGLAKQATAGAVGSAGHHGGDHDPGETDEPDLPHEPGDHPVDDPAHSLPQHLDTLPDLTRDDPTHPDGTHPDTQHPDPVPHDDPSRPDPTGPDHPTVDSRPDDGEPDRGTGSGDRIYDVLSGGHTNDAPPPQPHGTALAGASTDLHAPADTPSVAVPADVPVTRGPAPTSPAPAAHDAPMVVTDQSGARPTTSTPTPAAGPAPGPHPADPRTARPDGGGVVPAPISGHVPIVGATHLGDFHDRGARPDEVGWRGEAGRTLTVEQNAIADRFLRQAYANESVLTPRLREIAQGTEGGRLFGEEYARKGEDSFKRKLADEIAADPLLPMSTHLAEMKDAVRYTVGLPEHGYAEGARHVVDTLIDQGFEPVKFKNFWGDPEGYRGINSFWHDPRTGQTFEVQFHTEASFQAKSETHGLYEIERTTTDPAERERAGTEMNHRFAQVPVPDAAAGIGIGEHPLHHLSGDPYEWADGPADRSGDGPDLRYVTDTEAIELARESLHPTPSGYAFYPPGDDLLRFADAVHARDGVVNLDLHGSTEGFHIGDRILTGEQFARAVEVLRREGALTIGPHDEIRLGACDVARGDDSPAARFARESGYRVTAPTERLWTNLRGDEIVSSAQLRDGRWTPGQPPDGHWRTFEPDREVQLPRQREPLDAATGLEGYRARGGDEPSPHELGPHEPSPDEIAARVDADTARALHPDLTEAQAHDLARLYADPAVQRMLHDAPPELARALLHELGTRPELVSVLHDSPELRHSLLARPMTLHHVAEHPEAIHVLRDVVDELHARGAQAMLADGIPVPAPADLTPEQIASSDAAAAAKSGNPRQPGFDPTRRGDEAYLSDYLNRLYDSARPAQAELNGLANRIAADTGGEAKYREHPKDRTRAMDKARQKYAYSLDRLNDLAAACVVLERPADIYRALDTVRATPGVEITAFDDRLRGPQDSGYRDIQMTVRMSNGHAAEFRLHLRAIEGVSDWEHSLYEVRRDLDALADADGRSLTDPERAIRDGLLRREQAAFWAALGGSSGQGGTE